MDKPPVPEQVHSWTSWKAQEEITGALTEIFASPFTVSKVPEGWSISHHHQAKWRMVAQGFTAI